MRHGAGNTIGFNTQQGVSVVSGIQNVISQNFYIGKNGPALPVQSNDISLGAGANNNQPAPIILAANLVSVPPLIGTQLVAQISGVPVGIIHVGDH